MSVGDTERGRLVLEKKAIRLQLSRDIASKKVINRKIKKKEKEILRDMYIVVSRMDDRTDYLLSKLK
jgi:hypothetical protein